MTLSLDCKDGRYGGMLATAVGTFKVTGGTFESKLLHLKISGNGATGQIVATVGNDSIKGKFALGNDSGVVLLTKASVAVPPSVATLKLSPSQWHRDVTYLSRELPLRHANAFHAIDQATFRSEVLRVDDALTRKNGDENYFDLDRIVNSIGDAHTYINLPPDDANFPIEIERFPDCNRVVAAALSHVAALGTCVVAIDGLPVNMVRKKLLVITPEAETMQLRNLRVDDFLTIGMVLHGAGIGKARNSVTYTLRSDDGKQFADVVDAVSSGSTVRYVWAWRSRPLWQKQPSAGFWYTYLPKSQSVYCRFRDYVLLAKNAATLLHFVRRMRPSKLVIDMRGNSGGNSLDGLHYLIEPIRRMSHINRKGHIFALVDEATFSAAMANAAQLRKYTHALLVGQVIGERPNSYQEPHDLFLPNSGLDVRYSTRYYKFVDSGVNEIVPDKIIVPTWAEFRAGDDPVLDWALSYPRYDGL